MRTILKCQLFLALTQTAFVLGSVYFKYSVNHVDRRHHINPVVFAFIRESIAGSMMGLLAYLSTNSVPRRGDAPKLFFLGLALYCNQLFYIMGVDMSGVVVATCMQPAIPVFTAAMALTLGMEQPSLYKTFGILMASAGSICMVAGGGFDQSKVVKTESDVLLGNILLFLNTIAMALYYIYAKPVLAIYPPMAVAAWAYIIAALLMGCTAVWYNRFYQHTWYLPEAAYGPLLYWIVVCSICGYYIIAWAMKHLPSTQVAAFQCLQPLIGTTLGFMILGESLTVWDLGAIGVILGLFFVNRTIKEKPKPKVLPKIHIHRPVFQNVS